MGGDVELPFLIEYWLLIANGWHNPAMLAHTRLSSPEAFDKALDLFLASMPTPACNEQVLMSLR